MCLFPKKSLGSVAAGYVAGNRTDVPFSFPGGSRRWPRTFEPGGQPGVVRGWWWECISRAGNFAPRLREGDRIVYFAVKRKLKWRFVAVRRVSRRFDSHADAADWYASQALTLPSNCFVHGNEPKTLELTNGNPPKEIKARGDWKADPALAIRLWDATYRNRIRKWAVFLACQAEYLELADPLVIDEAIMIDAVRRIPVTQNPPQVDGGCVENCSRLSPHAYDRNREEEPRGTRDRSCSKAGRSSCGARRLLGETVT